MARYPSSFTQYSSGACPFPPAPPRPMVTAGTPSAMGMLLLVEDRASSGSPPRTEAVAMARWTSGFAGGVSPDGRSPILSRTSSMGLPSRRSWFSSTSARSMAAMKEASIRDRLSGLSDRMSTSIHASNGMEFTEVPPPMRPTL